jgi:hypothetical protein
MGDDVITAAMSIPIMATAAFRLHTGGTRLFIQNTFAACPSGVVDRTILLITDSRDSCA